MMKIQLKMGLLVIIIAAIIVTGITVLLLQRPPNTSIALNVRSVHYLIDGQAEYKRVLENDFQQALRPLSYTSYIKEDYGNIQALGKTDLQNGVVIIGTEESYIFTTAPGSTGSTTVLAVIIVMAAAVVFLFILSYMTGPIITVTETRKDNSGEEEYHCVKGENRRFGTESYI